VRTSLLRGEVGRAAQPVPVPAPGPQPPASMWEQGGSRWPWSRCATRACLDFARCSGDPGLRDRSAPWLTVRRRTTSPLPRRNKLCGEQEAWEQVQTDLFVRCGLLRSVRNFRLYATCALSQGTSTYQARCLRASHSHGAARSPLSRCTPPSGMWLRVGLCTGAEPSQHGACVVQEFCIQPDCSRGAPPE